MEDNSIDNSINRSTKTSITKFSSDLVKRSIEDLKKIHTGSYPIRRKPKILIVVDLVFGKFLKDSIGDLDYEVNTIESGGQLDIIYLELSRTKYEIVILTNTSLTATHIILVVPEIKKRFPNIRIIVISGDAREEYIKDLYDLKIDSFLKIPFEVSHLIQLITNQPLTEKAISKITKKINPTKTTPEIILDQNGIISIIGNSIPNNANTTYEPIIKWINKYINEPAYITQVNISLDNLNADSKKYLVILLQKVTYVRLKNKKFLINWHYKEDDDDILKFGEELSSSLDEPFNFILIN